MTNFFVFSASLITLWSQAKTAGAVEVSIQIDTNTRYQKFYGCGASWTDSAAWIMNGTRSDLATDPRPLEDYEKTEIFTSLFAKDGGIALDILRQPMGTSDFRWSDYTYQDDPDTPFSIGRDLSYIIPTIQQSQEHSYKRKIKVIAWTTGTIEL